MKKDTERERETDAQSAIFHKEKWWSKNYKKSGIKQISSSSLDFILNI